MVDRARIVELVGPFVIAIGVCVGVGLLRGGFTATAHGNPPYAVSATHLSGEADDPSLAPLFTRSANNERNTQIALLQEVVQELRAIRGLLQSGEARVRVDSVELDYNRLADVVSASMPRMQSGGAPAASIRRTSAGSNGNDAEESK